MMNTEMSEPQPHSELFKNLHADQIAQLEKEIMHLKSVNSTLESESKRETETFKSQYDSILSENHHLLGEVERLESEKEFQLQNLNQIQFSYESLQSSSSSEIEKLNSHLQAALTNNQGLESKLIDLTLQLERIELESKYVLHNKQNLETEMNKMKNKQDEDQKEMIATKDLVRRLSDTVKCKNAVISQFKLSEERFDLEMRKMKNIETRFNTVSSLAAKYTLIKSNLKTVFSNDQRFCNAMSSDENFGNISDLEICEIVNFILNDYISTKQNYFSDIQESMEKLNNMKTDLDQKSSLHNDLKQMFHLKVAEFKDKTEKVQNYSRKLEELSSENNKLIIKLEATDSELKRTKRKLSDNESGARQQLIDLKVLVDEKNNKIVELKNELSRSDKMQPKTSSKQFETFKQMNSGDLQLQKSISGLEESIKMKEQLIIILQKHNFVLEDKMKKAKKSPVANIDITRKLSQEVLQLQNQLKEQSNPNETEKLKDQIVQLQARQQKQEAEYNKRVQTYITNLNVMKEKVKAAMMEKDSQIEQLKRQIHNRHEEIILIWTCNKRTMFCLCDVGFQ